MEIHLSLFLPNFKFEFNVYYALLFFSTDIVTVVMVSRHNGHVFESDCNMFAHFDIQPKQNLCPQFSIEILEIGSLAQIAQLETVFPKLSAV